MYQVIIGAGKSEERGKGKKPGCDPVLEKADQKRPL